MKKVGGIRFKPAGKIYDFDAGVFVLNTGDPVIVETEQGLGFGRVVDPPRMIEDADEKRELKKVFRLATEADFEQRQSNMELEGRAYNFCQQTIVV